ncbi:MAG: M56 family metallopeptidase [Lachnospiraceae bacterium]|nr:M56 family metallopeptidase [Lachnospiraceae bacterium]
MLSFKMNMPFYLMVFYGSIMIAAVLVLRSLLRNKLPKFVFPILWSAVLLRLLVPFSLSSPLSMKVPEFLIAPPYEIAYADTVSIAEESPIESYVTEAAAGTAEQTITIAYQDTDSFQSRIFSLPLFIGFVYAAGFLITAGILLLQKYRYTKCLKDSLLIEHNETINALLREMGMGHILVFTNDQTASPLVCGLIAPKIYLPTRMDFGNTQLLRHILCHETMHIRRKDNIRKAVMLLALCVYWFHPLVWLMSKALCSDLEAACDEAVLRIYGDENTRKDYAFSLLAMAITGNRPTLLYSAFSKTEVERRIQSVLHYRKASALMIVLSVCLVFSGSVVFATAGQAPFSPELTSFCSSDHCRWGVRVNLTRDVSLGKDAQMRAEQILFDILRTDVTNDPDLLEMQITTALSAAFHVEKSAFSLEISLCLNRETLFEEYARWGLVRIEDTNDAMLYNGETIRTYQDKTLGRYMSQPTGAVDLTVVRDRLGYITAVEIFREGDSAYDEHTRKIEQNNRQYDNFPATEVEQQAFSY